MNTPPTLNNKPTKAEPWQLGAARQLDEVQPRTIRMSAAHKCPRHLAYVQQGFEPSDPDDTHSLNRMAMGHMAEILIIRDLHRQGWETRHTVLCQEGQLEVNLPITGTNLVMFGHPDGICRHPDFTRNIWVTLECKSMSVERAEETLLRGIAETYPSYITQIALYGNVLKQQQLVTRSDRGIFAMMDRDGAPLPPERVQWDPDLAPQTLQKIYQIVKQSEQQELPDRPYPPNAPECTYCIFHTLCHGSAADRRPERPQQVRIQDHELLQAALQWKEHKPQVDQARDKLQQACNDHQKQDLKLEDIIAGYFVPRSQPIYDPVALRENVPADILRKCLLDRGEQRHGFWIRKART